MLIAVFEDKLAPNFHPLSLTRPVYALRCGPSLLYEKILKTFPSARIAFFMRNYLSKAFSAKIPRRQRPLSINDLNVLETEEDTLVLNGRWIFDSRLLHVGEEVIAVKDDSIVYAYLKRRTVSKFLEKSGSLLEFLEYVKSELSPLRLNDARLIAYPWDLIESNSREINSEFEEFKRGKVKNLSKLDGVYHVGEKDRILIAESAKIYPCVVLDSSEGPIIIDEEAKIMPGSFIKGPCYIGKKTWIIGGKIEGSTIGPVCRVGGEVDESIIHGFSNKYHEGFLGHSYVGEWVNLGALSTTSDLKNNYTSVEVPIGGKLIDSGKLKIGAFIGDHTKTGIGSLFTTGAVVGVMCNLVTAGAPYPKYVPSFTWYVKGRASEGPGLEAMLKTARIAMDRRGVELTGDEMELFRKLYEMTRSERMAFIEKYSSKSK